MKPGLLAVFFMGIYSLAAAQNAYWQQQANYSIRVSLNDTDHSLDGFETIDYFNHSPDTLDFVWMHLWPNAYKNDRTAFTEQLIENGNTGFYFSNDDSKGYINRLAFKVNGSIAVIESHPQHQDIIKIKLSAPLAPGQHCAIETPFHVKLPVNISRGGHFNQSYQATQWYPKVAVYDKNGWHEMPYLDQGEFYSDFGNYEVSVTVPVKYTIAATGELTGEVGEDGSPAGNSAKIKTLVYRQDNVIDFAWFADQRFIVKKDSLLLTSGRIITVAAYSLPGKAGEHWEEAIKYIKKAVLTRSRLIGEYPYSTATAVQADVGYGGGMEYPTITLISDGGSGSSDRSVEGVIEHEVGHNWFYGIIASNERLHPWMDEGMNTYYNTKRYVFESAEESNPIKKDKIDLWKNRSPLDLRDFRLRGLVAEGKDQPIETSSRDFSDANYGSVAYYKTSLWMKQLETLLGTEMFDSCMRTYYRQWKFKHPGPEDFKKVIEETSGRNLGEAFAALQQAGSGKKNVLAESSVDPAQKNNSSSRPIKWASLFSFKETGKYKYLFASPAFGLNYYDKIMLGVLLHNYTLPAEKLQFLIAPLYATGSAQLNGIGRVEYKIKQGRNGEKLMVSLAGASFNGGAFTDSTGKKNYLRFSKIVPGLKYVFATNNPRSLLVKYIQWKTFLINEETLQFTRDTINDADIISYPSYSRYVNQLRLVVENNRALYPYNASLQAEQGQHFVRLAFTGNYFFNYPKGGGMNLRFFAGKFFYLGDKTFAKQFETDPYQLNMTGPKGYEDYTYSNYFAGRNEFDGIASQQIMQRDGFFKIRTDYLSSKVGKSDDWLAAANFTSDVPAKYNPLQVLPIKIPLKIFIDVGTYADAWQKGSTQGKFIYDAGIQVSVFKNTLNVYMPLLYSKVYRDYINSTITGSKFLKNIVFSIDIQNFRLQKLIPQFAF